LTKQRTAWRRIPLAVVTTTLILPLLAAAAPTETALPKLQLGQAQQAESQGDWAMACELYAQYLSVDRTNPEIKARFLFCLRNYHRVLRHSDESFKRQLHGREFTLRDAIRFYEDVLCKIQSTYYDESRTDLSRLFHEGLQELLMALDDKEFQKEYVSRLGISDADIQEMRVNLRNRWGSFKVTSRAAAVEQLREIIRTTSGKLNGKAAVLEFVCGACNALDEYSFYITEGTLGLATREDKTVVEARSDGPVGYIRLDGFGETTVQDLEAAYDHLRSSGMKVLVLDLRANLGGDLDVAAEVARRFMAAPTYIGSVAGKNNKKYRSYSMSAFDLPMFVLIDGATASAAEFLAVALKANDRAKLIGQNTFGKNLVQRSETFRMAPYGAIRLTWGQFYGPEKEDVSKGGVAPHIRVSGGALMADRQLEDAFEKARALVSMR
jgi:C-terminal peptidase prc